MNCILLLKRPINVHEIAPGHENKHCIYLELTVCMHAMALLSNMHAPWPAPYGNLVVHAEAEEAPGHCPPPPKLLSPLSVPPKNF